VFAFFRKKKKIEINFQGNGTVKHDSIKESDLRVRKILGIQWFGNSKTLVSISIFSKFMFVNCFIAL
jgi:hypothetical protein